MPRKTKGGENKISIRNMRKHVVRLSDDLSVPSLGEVKIPVEEYQQIVESNRYVRAAVQGRYLIAKLIK